MLETHSFRKNKISLSDYNYKKDIDNRLLMAQFSPVDIAVLEEVLFSSLTVSAEKIAKNIGESEEDVLVSLEKLVEGGLVKSENSLFVVDKEMRKYFETQAPKFDPDFKPDMEFLQGLLKKVPIHVLPSWYAIPRLSNNIFSSILEKYLITPLTFQRYLMEINFGDATLSAIAQDVFRSPNLQIPSKDLIEKYGLTPEQFEEHMLTLEFHFMCCTCYQKVGDEFTQIVTPFHEWGEYLRFLNATQTRPIRDVSKVERLRPSDYSFIQDMAAVLDAIKKEPVELNSKGYAHLLSQCEELTENNLSYLKQVIQKLCILQFAEISSGKLTALGYANEWLTLRLESKALFLYRHPLNRICTHHLPSDLSSERLIREAEKSIHRALHSGWVLFDEFIKGVLVPLNERTTIALKKTGKSWRYTLPEYTHDETLLIKATILEWLFEIGIVAIGTYEHKDCFCVTPFGQSLFG